MLKAYVPRNGVLTMLFTIVKLSVASTGHLVAMAAFLPVGWNNDLTGVCSEGSKLPVANRLLFISVASLCYRL